MANVQVTEALDLGNDVLLVRGTIEGRLDAGGKPLVFEARGWLSAMSHHYDADDYEELDAKAAKKRKCAPGRNLKKGATPRSMTASERLAYMRGLLLVAAGAPQGAAARTLPIPRSA